MDAGAWLWPGGWGSPVGIAIFMAGLGVFFAGFGMFLGAVGRLKHTKIAEAEFELKERRERARLREGGSQ